MNWLKQKWPGLVNLSGFFDRHFGTTVALVGTILVAMQIIIDDRQAKRAELIVLDQSELAQAAFGAEEKNRLRTVEERDDRWRFDIGRFVLNENDCDKLSAISQTLSEHRQVNFASLIGDRCQITKQRPAPITLAATSYVRSLHVSTSPGDYGPDLILNAPPYNARPNAATYEFDAIQGDYVLWATYAAVLPRPLEISINGAIVFRNGLGKTSESWTKTERFEEGRVTLRTGTNVLTLRRSNVFPHIRAIEFIPVKQ